MGKLKHALKLKCPQCGQGFLYPKKGGLLSMNINCENCGLKYEKETGFFYGAMYISYGINVFLFVIALIIFYTFEKFVDWRVFMVSYVLLTLLATKYIFRLSRSIWLAIMVDYKEE